MGTPLRLAALLFALSLAGASNNTQIGATASKPQFVGSESCRKCHADIFHKWQETRMANVVRNPRMHPEAVLGDFSHPNPTLTFNLGQVDFVYGSRWKQRYFTKRGNNYYPLPAQWDIRHRTWLPYYVENGADWWAPLYPGSNFERPTGPLCDGCHSVNYNPQTHEVTEWNVGCEKCHGPGSVHAEHPTRNNIVNPRRLDFVRANDVCIQCHSQGRPIRNPIEGKNFDWPVGFLPGQRLADVWNLEDDRLGTTGFYYWADGTAHKNRMQGNDFAQSVMYHRGVRCFDCHDVHSNKNPSDLIEVGNALCLGCHTADNPAGLHGTVPEHTHHAESSAGSQCTACHMPSIEQTLGDQTVAGHTFRFISPQLTQRYGIPNPCNSCHTDKSVQWALDQLRSWQAVSPWRVLR